MAMDVPKLLNHPLVALGALDLFLATVLALGVVSFYPFIRFRAALGLGFVGFFFWVHGHPLPVIALAAGLFGLYCCTIFVRYLPVLVFAGLGLCGIGAVSWHLMS